VRVGLLHAIYRFYRIRHDGHIAGPPTDHQSRNDADAVKQANRIIDGHDIEIRQAERIVPYVVPDKKKKMK
jgi:hypothetical protein